MRFEEMMESIKGLAQSQGCYTRLYNEILSLDDEGLKELKEHWESKNFKDIVDFILYIEN